MKRTILLIFTLCMLFGGYTPPVDCYYYGGLVMFNPQTKRYAILLGDWHVESKNISAYTQQVQVFTLIQTLQFQGQSVHLFVEDEVSFKIDDLTVSKISPLYGFVNLCKIFDIACTNIECRDYELCKQTPSPGLQKIKKETDSALWKRLAFYYSDREAMFAPYVDAYALNAMNKIDASVSVVLAGGAHIASISKELYRQGYKSVEMVMSDETQSAFQSHLFEYYINQPIVVDGEFLQPSHLPDIDKAVLGAVRKLDEWIKKYAKSVNYFENKSVRKGLLPGRSLTGAKDLFRSTNTPQTIKFFSMSNVTKFVIVPALLCAGIAAMVKLNYEAHTLFNIYAMHAGDLLYTR